jgi:hypothetical protein
VAVPSSDCPVLLTTVPPVSGLLPVGTVGWNKFCVCGNTVEVGAVPGNDGNEKRLVLKKFWKLRPVLRSEFDVAPSRLWPAFVFIPIALLVSMGTFVIVTGAPT